MSQWRLLLAGSGLEGGEAMEGLDDMIKSMSVTSMTSNLERKEKKCFNGNNDDDHCEVKQDEYEPESEEHIATVVQNYKSILNDLADSSINCKINEKLSKIKYFQFIEYYLKNASLSHYSIETELSRMDFEVTFNGNTTCSKTEIEDIFWETKLRDIWRFANQSIYADVLRNLQSYFEGLHLNISAVATSSEMKLDLDDDKCMAEGFFDIVLASHSAQNHKLKIASVKGIIQLSLKQKCLKQYLEQPSIKIVFDGDLREAAITFLASEDSNFELSEQHPRKIDAIVDAVADTAQTLPGQFSAIMTDFSIEGAVGFLGNLVGASKETEAKSVFHELSTALRENNVLPVESNLSANNMSSTDVDKETRKDDEEWDDWDSS